MEIWVTPLAGILGVIVGGLLSYLSTSRQFKRQEKLENKKRKIQKLEEIAELLERIDSNVYQTLSLIMLDPAANTKPTICRDSTFDPLSNGKSALPNMRILERVNILLLVYLPQTETNIVRLKKAWRKFGSLMVESAFETPQGKIERQQFNSKVISISKFISDECESIKSEIIKELKLNIQNRK